MATLSKGSLFPPHLIDEVISSVKGKSSVAKLSNAIPIPFNGLKNFTFSMTGEVELVAENAVKGAGELTLTPTTITPMKVVYQARCSNEFMYASQEEQISILRDFNEGYARKLARGLDLMAFHGVEPRSGSASALIGTNCFDQAVTQVVTSGPTADDQVEAAIALVQGSEYDVTGMAMAPAFRSSLAAITLASGERMYPGLAWGNETSNINGLPVDVNSTMSKDSTDLALVGDFRAAFRWGYSRQIPMEIIEYGDPDGSGYDLKAYNQICIRCETYLGWGILDPLAFALIKSGS